MPSGIGNAKATFQRLMAQTLTDVTKNYDNRVMCFVDDVVIDEVQVSFENIKLELCEAPVLGIPTEKNIFLLDTDKSVAAMSGALRHEQEWTGPTALRPIAYWSKVQSDTEMKYGSLKAEIVAVINFVVKYRAYLGSAPFKLRAYHPSSSCLAKDLFDEPKPYLSLDCASGLLSHDYRASNT